MKRALLYTLLGVQIVSAAFFIWTLLISILGLPPINWALYEAIELSAALGLLIGTALGFLVLRRTLERTRVVEDQLRLASGAFMELLNERFIDWQLTPAEKDVALFSIKGLSLQEIANIRKTSEGTVKAQTNAIYKKANVSGRPQLLSLFIDELIVLNEHT